MDEAFIVLYDSNMKQTSAARSIQTYNLFGEAGDLPDVVLDITNRATPGRNQYRSRALLLRTLHCRPRGCRYVCHQRLDCGPQRAQASISHDVAFQCRTLLGR